MKLLYTFLFVICSSSLFAQANVTGRCTSVNGQAVPNATVTAILFDDKQTTTTSSDGSFSFPSLNAGDWTIIVENNGRKTLRKVTVKNTPVSLSIVVGKAD